MSHSKEWANIFCEYSSLYKISELTFNRVKTSYRENRKISAHVYNQYEESLRIVNYMWKKAKIKMDFNIVKPYLENLVRVNKELILYLGYNESKYDTLLRLHNWGINSSIADEIFYELKDNAINLLDRIRVNKKQIEYGSFKDQLNSVHKKKLNNIVPQRFTEPVDYNLYYDKFFLYNIKFNII